MIGWFYSKFINLLWIIEILSLIDISIFKNKPNNIINSKTIVNTSVRCQMYLFIQMNYGKHNTPSNLSNNCLLTISLNHAFGHTVHEYGHRYTRLKLLLATLALLKHNINSSRRIFRENKEWHKTQIFWQCLF